MISHHSINMNSVPLLLLLLFSSVSALSQTSSSSSSTTNQLLNFLEKLQQTALETFGKSDFDPKLYVDLSLKSQLSSTEVAFSELSRLPNGSISAADLRRFVSEYFEVAGEDMVYSDPGDFVPEPEGFLANVESEEARAWALEIHSLWRNLSRRVSPKVLERPEFHTLIPLSRPIVIPGSRFREVYYWDSYWIIRGLLVSKMYDTAKGIVANLISLIDEYGFVLNGARTYYTNRSQPPLLSAMVVEIFKRTKDLEFARISLPALIKEHKFWTSGKHLVTIQDDKGCNHSLSRYYAMWNEPRPESSTTDIEFVSDISSAFEKRLFYREVASTAESGWDFSTRWMRNTSDFTTLATTSILPVDLNAFLLEMELNIAFLASVTGDRNTSRQFSKISRERRKSIGYVFWDAKTGQWLDYWLSNNTAEGFEKWEARNQKQSRNAFASNFIPIWITPFHSDTIMVEKITRSLQKSGLVHEAGIATSATNSGQQWDFPNGWAPIQHMVIEGLAKSGSKRARLLAKEIAVKWIRANYVSFKKTGNMHEKYNVKKCGYVGGGGEYVAQTGFGWSNGVILALLEEFGWPADLKIRC